MGLHLWFEAFVCAYNMACVYAAHVCVSAAQADIAAGYMLKF